MKKYLKSGLQSEDSIQRGFFKWVKYQEGIYPLLKALHAIPNGGSRNIIEATKLKSTGTRAGVPDMFLPYNNGTYNGLYLELKSAKGKLSKSQEYFIPLLEQANFLCVVCKSSTEAIDTVLKYIGVLKNNS